VWLGLALDFEDVELDDVPAEVDVLSAEEVDVLEVVEVMNSLEVEVVVEVLAEVLEDADEVEPLTLTVSIIVVVVVIVETVTPLLGQTLPVGAEVDMLDPVPAEVLEADAVDVPDSVPLDVTVEDGEELEELVAMQEQADEIWDGD